MKKEEGKSKSFFVFLFFSHIFFFLYKRHPLVRQELSRRGVPHRVRVPLAELDRARAVRVDLDRSCFSFY